MAGSRSFRPLLNCFNTKLAGHCVPRPSDVCWRAARKPKLKFPLRRHENGGIPMKYALWTAAFLLAMVQQQPALAQGNGDSLVKQAVTAEGGADALRGVKGLSIKGDAKFWEPGQSFAPDGDPRILGDATFTMTWDLAKGSART